MRCAETSPPTPGSVHRYLQGQLGDSLAHARQALTELANALDSSELAAKAYPLYGGVPPGDPGGQEGLGCGG